MNLKKCLIGLFIIALICCGNGQFLFALQNRGVNNDLDNGSSARFDDNLRNGFNSFELDVAHTADFLTGKLLLVGSDNSNIMNSVMYGSGGEYHSLKDAIEKSKPVILFILMRVITLDLIILISL
jgi:hypothetical protein